MRRPHRIGENRTLPQAEGAPSQLRKFDRFINPNCGPHISITILCRIAVTFTVPGGRLVVLDRGPAEAAQYSQEIKAKHHEVAPAVVESALRKSGFELVNRQDRFIDLR